MRKIGVIGYGTIGRHIAQGVMADPEMELKFICRRKEDPVEGIPVIQEISSGSCRDVDLVIEAAGPQIVEQTAMEILQHADFMIFSITALADEGFMEKVLEACRKYQRSIFVPHGAILGLDGILDGKSLLSSVKITTIKSPRGFGLDSDEKQVLYQGSTRGACRAYPKNVNVHAAVALAGLGFDQTSSSIVADPQVKGNTHIIAIEGEGVSFEIRVQSIPQGAVTGKYTPYSGLGSVKRVLDRKPGIHIV